MVVDTWAADFATPFEVDKLLEVRTSGMKKMPGLNVDSGIDKNICGRPMRIGKLGLEGDWHDLTFHGGPDKAILGCKSWSRSPLKLKKSIAIIDVKSCRLLISLR